MQLKQIQLIKTALQQKIRNGDYITLSEVLQVPTATATSRYRRNDVNTVNLMLKIVEGREKLIEKLRK